MRANRRKCCSQACIAILLCPYLCYVFILLYIAIYSILLCPYLLCTLWDSQQVIALPHLNTRFCSHPPARCYSAFGATEPWGGVGCCTGPEGRVCAALSEPGLCGGAAVRGPALQDPAAQDHPRRPAEAGRQVQAQQQLHSQSHQPQKVSPDANSLTYGQLLQQHVIVILSHICIHV